MVTTRPTNATCAPSSFSFTDSVRRQFAPDAVAGATTAIAAAARTTLLSRSHLDEQRVALTATRADRGEAETAPVPAQLVHEGGDDPPAGRTDWMAERDGTPVHIDDLLVHAEHPRRVLGDG